MFQESVLRLSECLKQIVADNIDLNAKFDQRALLTDFKKRKSYQALQAFRKALEEVRRESSELHYLVRQNPDSAPTIGRIAELVGSFETKDKPEMQKSVNEILLLAKGLPAGLPKASGDYLALKMPKRVPEEIKAELVADTKELEKCYANGCYRSAIILCGRLLETALHRKYYEVTNFDILEKNPGIGLGNLVAKLAEKNVQLDPGLTQQIHLINQVRIFSVHKKKESFHPSKEQTQAIILYTTDILNKLF
jgi:hypothetical protein